MASLHEDTLDGQQTYDRRCLASNQPFISLLLCDDSKLMSPDRFSPIVIVFRLRCYCRLERAILHRVCNIHFMFGFVGYCGVRNNSAGHT